MPSSRFLIASNTLGSSAASVTFSSIPATYKDLVLKISARSDRGLQQADLAFKFNSATANATDTSLYGNGSTASSGRDFIGSGGMYAGAYPGSTATSDTFSNTEIYIPNYTASQNKPSSISAAAENNTATVTYGSNWAVAGLWSNTAAITSITIYEAAGSPFNLVAGSTFWLYGIKNS